MLEVLLLLAALGSEDDIRVIENGAVSKLLQNNLTTILPPIKPQYKEITIKFASEKRVRILLPCLYL